MGGWPTDFIADTREENLVMTQAVDSSLRDGTLVWGPQATEDAVLSCYLEDAYYTGIKSFTNSYTTSTVLQF